MNDCPGLRPDRGPRWWHTSLHWSGAAVLLMWSAFWTWFIVANVAAEGVAWPPVIMLLAVWATATVTWRWPRVGSVPLLAIAAWALSFLRGDSSVRFAPALLIAAPTLFVAAAAWLSPFLPPIGRLRHGYHVERHDVRPPP